MVIKKDFILRKIAGEDVVIPIGNNIADFNGIITLNETAAFLWKELQSGQDEKGLLERLCQEYDATEEEALQDIQEFLSILREHHILEGK